MGTRRAPGAPFEIASYLWKLRGNQYDEKTFMNPGFRMLLGASSHMLKSGHYNKLVLMATLRDMMNEGIKVETPWAVSWRNRQSGKSWYETVVERISNPPPIYDEAAVRRYQELYGDFTNANKPV